MSVWGSIAGGWRKFARGFGLVQTTIILSVLYFVLLGLAFLVHRIARRDPMSRGTATGRGWRARRAELPKMESVERRF